MQKLKNILSARQDKTLESRDTNAIFFHHLATFSSITKFSPTMVDAFLVFFESFDRSKFQNGGHFHLKNGKNLTYKYKPLYCLTLQNKISVYLQIHISLTCIFTPRPPYRLNSKDVFQATPKCLYRGGRGRSEVNKKNRIQNGR